MAGAIQPTISSIYAGAGFDTNSANISRRVPIITQHGDALLVITNISKYL